MKSLFNAARVSLLLMCLPFDILAQGDLIGPVYPPPLSNTRSITGGADAVGKTGGITWTIGNVALVEFDEVYWGPKDGMIRMSMNNNTYTVDEVMDYRSDLSNLGNGVMIFTGTTNTTGYSAIVNTRCVIRVTTTSGTPLSLRDASTLGLPENVGAVGSLREWGITATGYFKVNIKLEASFNTTSYFPAFSLFDSYHTSGQVYSDVEAAFYYENSFPVLETNNTITMQEGQTVILPQSVLKSSDVESGVSQIIYTIGPVSGGRAPVHGLLRLGGVALGLGGTFTQDNINRGQVTYTHNGDISTSDDFTFTIRDGQGAALPISPALPYVFNIQISQVNHPPVAVNGFGTATVGTMFYGQFQASDSDLPEQALSFSIVRNGSKGTATLLGFNDGSFSYEPEDDAFGMDTLIFQVSDGELNSVNDGRFVITINNNHAPVIIPVDDLTIEENAAESVSIISSDPDADQITLTVNNLPGFATFNSIGNGNGTILFTPQTGDTGYFPGIEIIAEDNGTPVRTSREEFSLTVIPEIKPIIHVYPSGLMDFDTVVVGRDSSAAIRIHNPGNGILTISNIFLNGGDVAEFVLDIPALPAQVSPGDSVTVMVHFSPVIDGVIQTTLIIESNDPVNDPVELTLRGYAVQPPSDVIYHLGDLKAPPTASIEYPVAIELFDNVELCAFGFNLIFDPAVVTYQDWIRGPVIPGDGYYTTATIINDSTLHISGFRKYGPSISQSGDIAFISFLVLETAALGPTDLAVIHSSAGNCLGLDLVTNCYDTGHIIVDIYARLTGTIYYFDPLESRPGRRLAKIPVLLTDRSGTLIDQTVSDENGCYEIDSVLTLQDYILKPEVVDDETNLRRTVNSTDAFRAFSAANESLPFPNPFQYEIGDANNSDSFNSTDAFVIFQLASYQIPNLRSYGLNDWDFVPVRNVNLAKCPVGYPHEIEFSALLRDTDDLDFLGGINADVNGTGNELVSFPKIQSNPVIFHLAAARLFGEHNISVPVSVETCGENICALQLDIDYNDSQLEYTGHVAGSLTPDPENWMIYVDGSQEHRIMVAGFAMNTKYAICGDGVLLFLNFKLNGAADGLTTASVEFRQPPLAGGEDGFDLPVAWDSGVLSIEEPMIADRLELHQNYPNPFNPVTTIEFNLPEIDRVRLKIYNTIGEVVDELVNQELAAGIHRFTWEAHGFASGVYYYRLETHNAVMTGKMLLLQ